MRIDVMTKNIRNLALATMSGFRHKTVDMRRQ